MTASSGNTTTTAYYGGLAESVTGALSYLLSDGLGSVSEAVSTTSGSVTATQLYGPYGAVRYQSGTLQTDKGYTGQRSDAATSGLDYYGARYYDAVAGQFTSADTTLAGGLNEYAYVGGNPESRTDPSGHRYTTPIDWIGPRYKLPQIPDDRNYDPYIHYGRLRFYLAQSADNCYPQGCYDPNGQEQKGTEADDGNALAAYFGTHVQHLPEVNAQKVTNPDYLIYTEQQYAALEVGGYTLTAGAVVADSYAPTRWELQSWNAPYQGQTGKAIRAKGAQASIVVVDLRYVDPKDTMSKDAMNDMAAQAIFWAPNPKNNASQVARVIFVNRNPTTGQYVVVNDFNPLNYGPAPVPPNAMGLTLD